VRTAAGGRTGGLLSEVLGFVLAGGAAYAADLGLFVWLRGPGGLGPLSAKALSFVAGCTVAYLGNALGTYRGRTPSVGRARRYGVFFAVNIAGALVQLLCLACSHYLLGLTAPRDDLVSGLGVGMVLATALRFWGTRTLVFGAGGRGASGAASGRVAGTSAVPGAGTTAGPGAGTSAGSASEPVAGSASESIAGPVAPSPDRGTARLPRSEEGNRPTWTG
jgi:putative flippase GtrA